MDTTLPQRLQKSVSGSFHKGVQRGRLFMRRLRPPPADIKEAGGKMVVEAMEVPGVGELSLFEDPDGRVLGLWKQKK